MFMLMGSADALPTAPKEKTVFIEDMTEADAARLVSSCTCSTCTIHVHVIITCTLLHVIIVHYYAYITCILKR